MQKKWLVALPVCAILVMAAQTKPKPVPKKVMENGKKVYDMYCLACHQADGGGVPKLNPPLVKTTFVLGDKKKLVQIILKGMTEQVEINGNTYDNVMAPHDFMTDQEISDVLTYVRNSFGNKASAVGVGEVKKVRETLK
jgi:mono/diheme cytochrome c family protein